VAFIRNPDGKPMAAARACATGDGRVLLCASGRTSSYFNTLVGSTWGVRVQAPPNHVIIGVTPVTGGGEAILGEQEAEYGWPAWVGGQRSARFIMATPTPGGPPPPTPTSVPAPRFDMWLPPEQPDFSSEVKRYTATQYIENLWEPLRLAHPDYISREVLGQDATGQYDIYSYTFAPPAYEKTFLITASQHGNEIMGQMALYRFLWHLSEESETHPALTYLRIRVRFVVIPMVNPWGVSQPHQRRANAHGVDLNRNYAFRWEAYASVEGSEKGSAPFSEAESRIVRDWLAQYMEADLYFDLHNGGPTMHPYTAYVPIFDATSWIPANRVIDAFRREGEQVRQYQLGQPMAHNYAAWEHRMLAFLPEHAVGAYSDRFYDSTDLFYAVRWYGNLIIQYSTWP
jgi:hypothetical protein